jgi:hypothetical protein
MLAIINAFEEWRHHLEGATHQIVVCSDNIALKHFMTKRKLNPRQGRWATFLSGFDFVIKHNPGKTNKADGLLRRPDLKPAANSDKEEVLLLEQMFRSTEMEITLMGEDEEFLNQLRTPAPPPNVQKKINESGWTIEEGIIHDKDG